MVELLAVKYPSEELVISIPRVVDEGLIAMESAGRMSQHFYTTWERLKSGSLARAELVLCDQFIRCIIY